MTYSPSKGREDNFGHLVTNPLTEILDVPGHHEFAPYRKRVFKDGNRVFLQYGTDGVFSDTDAGTSMVPGSDQTLTLQSAKRILYPVGYDIIATHAFAINQAPQSGDVVAGGFGDPDVDNFDPSTESYSGSNADGYFWYLTSNTGIQSMILAVVRDGSILDSVTVSLNKDATVWGRFEQWLNWYDVGPCRFYETFTDVANDRQNPQKNELLSSVANDDGKGPLNGSKRIRFQIHQASGNSGLELEVGSMSGQVPGRFDHNFAEKGFHLDVTPTNTTDGQWEPVAAIQVDPNKPLVQTRIDRAEIVQTASDTTDAEVIVMAVDPSSTNFVDSDFSYPPELSRGNDATRTSTNAAAGDETGPDADGSGTDSTGPDTVTSMSDPGGYQLAIHEINQVKNQGATQASSGTDRVLNDGDIGLVMVDTSASENHEISFTISENT